MIVKNPNTWGNRCEMFGESTGLMITNTWHEERIGAIVDPQSVLDIIHKLYPNLTFSPPVPEEGDKVITVSGQTGWVRYVSQDWACVEFVSDDETTMPLIGAPLSSLTVVG